MNSAYNMDCMDAMRKMPDKFFDLAVVDPRKTGSFKSEAGSYGAGAGF